MRSATFIGLVRGDLRGAGGVPFSTGEAALNCVAEAGVGVNGATLWATAGTEMTVGICVRSAATSLGKSNSAVTAASATRLASVAIIFSKSSCEMLVVP